MLTISSNVKNLDFDTIKALEKVLLTSMKYLNQPLKQTAFNVYFVSEKRIKELNKEQRNIDKVTDVLSFPFTDIRAGEIVDFDKYSLDIDRTNNTLLLGEIVICNQRAKEQAKKFGHSYLREVCFLFLHGVLHCLGYDHIEESDRVVMEDLQNKILNKCNITRE